MSIMKPMSREEVARRAKRPAAGPITQHQLAAGIRSAMNHAADDGHAKAIEEGNPIVGTAAFHELCSLRSRLELLVDHLEAQEDDRA